MYRTLPLGLLVLALSLTACSSEPEVVRDDAGAVVTEGAVDNFDVAVGDCLLTPDGQSEVLTGVTAVPCSQPHGGEVYALFDLPDGPYPGAEEVRTAGNARCEKEFEPYVGISFQDSRYAADGLGPSQERWEQSGDREYVCIVLGPDGEQLTGSVRGSAQ